MMLESLQWELWEGKGLEFMGFGCGLKPHVSWRPPALGIGLQPAYTCPWEKCSEHRAEKNKFVKMTSTMTLSTPWPN